VLPLEAVTENAALPDNGTVKLEGWAVMMGGVCAKQVLKISKLVNGRQIAAFINRQSQNGLFLKKTTNPIKAGSVPLPKNDTSI
jgi:hypothetical protein